ncbi:cell division protein SepF [Streptomyces sp. MUM 203J]|nr:cell division protein SepF [Streptomyces sp. MUM 203J]
MDVLVLTGRILFAVVFIGSALNHLTNTGNMAGYAESRGVPPPTPAAVLGSLLILVAGVMPVPGVRADPAALLPAVFLLPAGFVMHAFRKESDPVQRLGETTRFKKDWSLGGVALMLPAFSPAPGPIPDRPSPGRCSASADDGRRRPAVEAPVSELGRTGEERQDGRMSRYERYDVTDEQWEGLAQVVPLRGRDEWPSRVDHRMIDRDEDAAAQRRMVVLRVQVFADAREVAEYLVAQVPVLLDLTSADGDVAKRILDFSSGVVFGLGSSMHRVDRNVFLLTPSGTEVEGTAAAAVPHA